ncbi:MAG TPA: NAD(P)/FAD-dependent oxidoreductase [Burkholderiaceae bacterium]|nr:NAD(P)/FAD-dependent oxidoreductase [Burkholderiaceae bacterium]
MDELDVVVAGAGVVGLACARVLAQAGRAVVVLEADEAIGTGISSRSSEVIHAGIYYAPGSAKARHCVRGRRMLLAYCAARDIAHRVCGKLIVATRAEDETALARIGANARANGVEDLVVLDAATARAWEPNLRCTAALFSPGTGIVDSHALMQALRADAEAHGAHCVLHSPVRRVAPRDGRLQVDVGGADPCVVTARAFVNATGLGALDLARRSQGLALERIPRGAYAKGSYFALPGRAPFSRLVYPVPEPGGLGVHLTLDLAGQARFGPDVEWVDAPNYTVDPRRAERFYRSIRGYWPGLPDGALQPGYAGIRPKLDGPPADAADFLVLGPADHGVPGLVHLFGIESPGLTSALSIAADVAQVLGVAHSGKGT